MTRVELRCTNAAQRPSPVFALKSVLAEWLETRGVAPVEIDRPDAAALPLLRAELARREAAAKPLALVPVLIEIGRNDVTPPQERVAMFKRAGELLTATGAPVAARATAVILATANDADLSGSQRRKRYRAILADAAIAADPASAATLKLMIADPAYRLGPPADAGVLLREVVDDKRLSGDDGLRVGALIRLANLQAAAGLIADARQSYAATGLDAQQCPLVDAQPALKSGSSSSADFSQEALRWGFEGWVKTEFDIAADGRTLNQRSVIAYPPFVFRDAGVGIAKGLRYRQTYRPDSGLGCTGQDMNVNFVLP